MGRFVVTGSGRCGTWWTSRLLTAAGLPCGHEKVFNHRGAGVWPPGAVADSSWMATPHLAGLDLPVLLLVRHPLRVVASWVEIGFFTDVDAGNPTHKPLQQYAPHVYRHDNAADRALDMWATLTTAALPHAEIVWRLETVTAGHAARLAAWAGGEPDRAHHAYAATPPGNRHQRMRDRTGVTHPRSWQTHQDRTLVDRARHLARLVGYDPDEAPEPARG